MPGCSVLPGRPRHEFVGCLWSGAGRGVVIGLVLTLVACQKVSPAAPGDLPSFDGTPPAYDRSAWRHWTDADGDCLDTRHEVLQSESLIPPTVEDCRVIAGQWRDVYTGTVYSDPWVLDVDHLVALSDAHASGGWQWSAGRREAFANALEDPRHLVAVHRSVNRSKGARGPDAWLPALTACWYVDTYADIKSRWALELTATQLAATAACRDLRTPTIGLASPTSDPRLRRLLLNLPGGVGTRGADGLNISMEDSSMESGREAAESDERRR